MPKTVDQDQATWDWELGTGLVSDYDDDGFLNIQIDAQGDDAGAGGWDLHHTFGFASRPRDADEDGYGCAALFVQVGDEGHVWVQADPRYADIIPPLKKGGSCQYGATGTIVNVDGETGTWTCYAPVAWNAAGTPTKVCAAVVGVDAAGDPIISLAHGDGMGITMLDNELALKNAAGDVRVELKSDGLYLIGNVKIIGAMLTGEGTAGFPIAVWNAAFTLWVQQVTAAVNAAAPGSVTPPLTALTGGTVTSLGQ